VLDGRLLDILERLDRLDGLQLESLSERIEDIQRKQDEIGLKQDAFCAKQEEADSVRRSQIDCISKRVFDAEKQLSEAQQLQDDAIAKANAVFEKHAADVGHAQENLMSVINQVNRNFEHLSSEIAQHGEALQSCQDDVRSTQLNYEQVNQMVQDLQKQSSFSAIQTLTMLEQAMQNMQLQMHEVSDELSTMKRTDMNDLYGQLQDLRAKTNCDRDLLQRFAQQFSEQDDCEFRVASTRYTSGPASAAKEYRRFSDMSDRIVSDRGGIDQDIWGAEASAPEPTALAQPAFCSRPRLAEGGPDHDALGGGTFPFMSSQSRGHRNMSMPSLPSGPPEQQHYQPSFSTNWTEEPDHEAEVRRGGMPPLPSMAQAGGPRHFHTGGPNIQRWHVDRSASSDADDDEIIEDGQEWDYWMPPQS
jgi:polyhydroxyalkanoate synthesis regulator phasin